MLTVFAVIVAGLLIGRLAPAGRLGFVAPTITVIIWALLFLLGVEAGGNQAVVSSLATLGRAALVIFACSVAGSIAVSWLLWRYLRHRIATQTDPMSTQPTSLLQALRGSGIIIAFFFAGCLAGYMGWLPATWLGLSVWVLYGLMFCVGVSLGGDRTLIRQIRRLDPRLGLLPVATAVGTLGGAAIAATMINPWSVTDSLAVGAGFGYYSLSSIFIADFRGAELATIALMCNILRELFTLVAAPLVARCAGPLAAVSIGGATTFDTTLPVITQAAGRPYAVVAIFHGCVLDFSVPFLVTLFCSI